jgi:hypothetical protein
MFTHNNDIAKNRKVITLYLKYSLALMATLFHFDSFAQNSQYVWAENGLTLRDTPSKTGNFTMVYSNHVIKSVNIGEGGGSVKFIFLTDRTFKDGFLLLNYFEDFDFTKKD